jgi:hypothetical protein
LEIDPGTLLKDRYRIERLLGRGGMASVWLAEDRVLDRPVAVKVLSDTIASDPEFLARFRREARLAASLWHPNLVGVYDYGAGAERPYLVMEFVPGPTLSERMKGGEEIDCERLARELLGAVAHIHAAGIVHRDIKPQNVLIAPDGSVRLIDFGIALPSDATALTRTGHLLGTARYLAPEVLNGAPASRRSDLYSCGVLLRDCLGVGSSVRLRGLVEGLAAADPRARPGSAEQVLARLDGGSSVPDEPTERLRPESGPAPIPDPVARGRRWASALALTAAVAGLAAVFVVAFEGSQEKQPVGKSGRGKSERTPKGDRTTAGVSANAAGAAAAAEGEASPVPAPSHEDPELGSSLNQEGFEMIQAGEYEQAVPVLREAVAAFPVGSEELDYAYALFNLGNALRLSGHPEEAIPVLERRLEIPNQADVVRRELEAAENEAGA